MTSGGSIHTTLPYVPQVRASTPARWQKAATAAVASGEGSVVPSGDWPCTRERARRPGAGLCAARSADARCPGGGPLPDGHPDVPVLGRRAARTFPARRHRLPSAVGLGRSLGRPRVVGPRGPRRRGRWLGDSHRPVGSAPRNTATRAGGRCGRSGRGCAPAAPCRRSERRDLLCRSRGCPSEPAPCRGQRRDARLPRDGLLGADVPAVARPAAVSLALLGSEAAHRQESVRAGLALTAGVAHLVRAGHVRAAGDLADALGVPTPPPRVRSCSLRGRPATQRWGVWLLRWSRQVRLGGGW